MALYDKAAKRGRRAMPKWHTWLVQDREWEAQADPFQVSVARMFGVPGHLVDGPPWTHVVTDASGAPMTVVGGRMNVAGLV